MKAIINGIILTPHEEIRGMALLFDTAFRGIVPLDHVQADEIIDAKGRYIAPGLIDVHIHGYLGKDISDGSEEGARIMAEAVDDVDEAFGKEIPFGQQFAEAQG